VLTEHQPKHEFAGVKVPRIHSGFPRSPPGPAGARGLLFGSTIKSLRSQDDYAVETGAYTGLIHFLSGSEVSQLAEADPARVPRCFYTFLLCPKEECLGLVHGSIHHFAEWVTKVDAASGWTDPKRSMSLAAGPRGPP
jgi:hypothetical protein